MPSPSAPFGHPEHDRLGYGGGSALNVAKDSKHSHTKSNVAAKGIAENPLKIDRIPELEQNFLCG